MEKKSNCTKIIRVYFQEQKFREKSLGRGGGALNFFSGRGVRPGFPKCGACELTFASEKGACERKISKFGGL